MRIWGLKKYLLSVYYKVLMEQIVEKLDKINNTLECMLSVMKQPESRVMTILKYAGAIVGALGILTVIELIRQWIIGG